MVSLKKKYIVDPFLKRVDTTIRERGLIENNQLVLVAVSGGADSVALLHSLARISDDRGWRLAVCCVHHGVRAQAADEELEFVENIACSLGLPFVLKRLKGDLKTQARKEGSLENVMREARYEALCEAANEFEANVIATGHHKDDQAETILWHLLRGSGIDGLKGFLPRSNIFGVTIVRPLYDLTREEIHRWLNDQGITWCEDESNEDVAFTRNRIRAKLIPLLKRDYQPALTDVLHRMADFVAADISYLECESEKITSTLVKSFGQGIHCIHSDEYLNLPLSMQRRILRKVVEQVLRSINPPASTQITELHELIKNGRAGAMYRGVNGLTGYMDYNRIFIMKCESERPASAKTLCEDVAGRLQKSGYLWSLAPVLCPRKSLRLEISLNTIEKRKDVRLLWNDRIWHFQWTADGQAKQNSMNDSVAEVRLLTDRLPETLTLRFREDGDRVRKSKSKTGKKIKDLFIDKKVSLTARDHIPLLANEKSVFWIPGIWGASQKLIDDKKKSEILLISVSPLKE